jgi:hypothetical protein
VVLAGGGYRVFLFLFRPRYYAVVVEESEDVPALADEFLFGRRLVIDFPREKRSRVVNLA